MTAGGWLSLLAVVVVVAYLAYAMLRPERF